MLQYSQRAEAIDPKGCASLQLQGRAYLDLASDLDKAERAYAASEACMLSQRHSSKLLAEVREAMGQIHLRRENFTSAIHYFQQALASGDMEDATCNLSVALYRLHRLQEALLYSARCVRSGDQVSRLGTGTVVFGFCFLFSPRSS